MKLRSLLFFLLVAVRVWADPLGDQAEVTPVSGWILAKNTKPSPAPTLQYVPADGRNATVLISIFPAGRAGVSDAATLRVFNRIACTPYLPTPDAPVKPQELKLATGQGIYVTFEDPDLVGKPPRKGDYKAATTVSLYLGHDVVIHATILCDDVGADVFAQAMTIVKNVTVKPAVGAAGVVPNRSSPAASPTAEAGGGVVVRPPAGFAATGVNPNDAPGYFSYARGDGVMLSGWLDQAAKFKGMRSFWATEKASLETHLGIKVTNEAFKILNGWNVVSYEMKVGDLTQQNIRACRVQNDTWADVHLSQTSERASQNVLESVLAEIKMVPAR